jgi:tetratricopeptide (TPR) repeat protein
MSCPRCGFSEPGPVECPRCGVVFAKLDRPARPALTVPAEVSSRSSGPRFSWLDAALLVAFAASVAVIVSRSTQPPPARREAVAVPTRERPAPMRRTPSPPERQTPLGPPSTLATPGSEQAQPGVLPPTQLGGVPAWRPALDPVLRPEDTAVLLSLFHVVGARIEIESSHVDQAEALLGRYPAVPDVGRILEQVLELAGHQASQRGRPAEAVRYRERATELLPGSSGTWLRLLHGHQASGAWKEAERAARRGLSALPDESFLHLALASALSKQGRDEEAADVLRRRLASRNDEAARTELARLERELQSVAGLARRTSSHFSIRFEGQEDAALGNALLQVLEDKYSMLARILDSEPGHEIPVVLYPRETFRSISTAPDWAGGYYSRSDSRIRIGTRDLSPGFVPVDLERTLTHELTHAFIHASTRGAVPDDINEGLAQYLSGRRLGYRLDPSRAVIRDGRMKVDDFYDSALSFVEYLLDRYRQSTMNDLLKYAGATGNVDQAFRRAYHQSYDETREEWIEHLQ